MFAKQEKPIIEDQTLKAPGETVATGEDKVRPSIQALDTLAATFALKNQNQSLQIELDMMLVAAGLTPYRLLKNN